MYSLLFSMLFDKEMSPLGFTAEEMYNFILHSFHRVNLIHHENALEWLQVRFTPRVVTISPWVRRSEFDCGLVKSGTVSSPLRCFFGAVLPMR